MTVKLLTEQHLEFLPLKEGCTGLSESILVKMPHCWKSHVAAQSSSTGRRWFLVRKDNNVLVWYGDNCDMYELCSNLVFMILYILLNDKASINANHSWVIYPQFLVTNQVLFVKLCEYQK